METDAARAQLAKFLGPPVARDPGWRWVLERARIVSAPQGAVLFRTGDHCKDFVIVIEGCIRVQYMDAGGNEIVLYRVQPGETCILTTSCLMGSASYPAEGIVEEPLVAALLPLADFQAALAHESVRNFVCATMGRRIVDLMRLVDELAFKRMDRRLAQYLAAQVGSLQVTHQEIAVELGTAREVVSRLLKDFERRGWVALGRGRIEVRNQERLAALGRD